MDGDHQNNIAMRLLRVEDFQGLDCENKSPFDILLDICEADRKRILCEEKRVLISQPSASAEKKKMTAASTSGDQEKYGKEVAVINNNNINAKEWHCNFGLEKLLTRKNSNSTLKISRNPDSVSVADQDDHGDSDWQQDKAKSTKGRRRQVNDVKKKRRRVVANIEPPQLPERFRQRINELNGRDIKLVIQKRLFRTDVSSGHDRLSIPFSKIISSDFLREDEKAKLKSSGGPKETIEVPIIDPQLNNEDIKLRLAQWDMPKECGKTCSNYVLRSKWNNIVEDNKLREYQIIQVWSFRVEGSLHMALVLVQPHCAA